MFDDVLNQLAIFDGFDNAQRNLLRKYFVICECAANEVIFEQNEYAEYLYIVVEGEVSVRFKPDDGPPLVVSRLKKGDVFGWSAAFGSGEYTSGASCECATRLLRVRGADLRKLYRNHPETGILVLDRLASIVAQRFEKANSHSQIMAFLEHGLRNGVKPIGG